MKELTKSICSVSVELSKKGQFLYRKFDKEMESDQLYQPINTDPIDFTSIIIDKSNRWRLYPKRNKSISCYSTKIENSYKVFPISNQILIYGNTNSWNTNFEKYLHPLTLVGFNKFIFDLMIMCRLPAHRCQTYDMLSLYLKKIDKNIVESKINSGYFDSIKNILGVSMVLNSILNKISILDPIQNGIVKVNLSDIIEFPIDREIWFNSAYYVEKN